MHHDASCSYDVHHATRHFHALPISQWISCIKDSLYTHDLCLDFLENKTKSFVPVMFPHKCFRGDPVLVREFLFPVFLSRKRNLAEAIDPNSSEKLEKGALEKGVFA